MNQTGKDFSDEEFKNKSVSELLEIAKHHEIKAEKARIQVRRQLIINQENFEANVKPDGSLLMHKKQSDEEYEEFRCSRNVMLKIHDWLHSIGYFTEEELDSEG